MGSIAVSPPIGSPMQYDPRFKVDVCLHEPLWGGNATTKDVALDVMSICSELDLLCQKELAQHSSGRIDNGNVTRTFETKAMLLLGTLKSCLQKLPNPQPSPEYYLEYTGFDKLFPRAAAYVVRPNNMSLASKVTAMDGYFAQQGTLHQVVSIAHQINSDVTNLTNHKYMAHQIALLYQSLNALGSQSMFASITSNIQDNFKTVKEALTAKERSDVELLPEHAQWLLEVTSSIVQSVASFPAQLTGAMFQPAHTLTQLT